MRHGVGEMDDAERRPRRETLRKQAKNTRYQHPREGGHGSLQKPSRNVPESGGLDNEQPERGGSLSELTNLLLAVAFLVVLHPFIDVRLAPPEHAVDEDGECVSHRRNRFRRAEFAAEATVLGTKITLAAEEGRGADP